MSLRPEVVGARRIVVKVGSSSLTTAAGGIDPALVERLVDVLAAARARGIEVVLVSSGAIAAGLAPLGGLLAGQIFAQLWKRLSKEAETPEPLSPAYSTREVLLAATLQGAIFGLVKTAVDRYGMKAYRRAVEKPRAGTR